MPILEIEDLNVSIDTLRGKLQALDHINLQVNKGETLGIVGESGCGKSLTSLAIMSLLPDVAKVSAKKMDFLGTSLLGLSEKEKRKLRGSKISMIFQDPMTSLNPCFKIGDQLCEVIKEHQGGSKKELIEKSVELLKRVGIPDPESQMNAYPHQLSGGMCQRVMIATAIACQPELLIADEPTTALDVTIQAQILDLLKDIQKERNMSIILITHDIGVVAKTADRIAVMYAGQIVESGNIREVLDSPRHPYTESLLSCLPGMHKDHEHKMHLPSIPGLVPDLVNRPSGCQLNPRCKYTQDICKTDIPEDYWSNNRLTKCHMPITAKPTDSEART